MSEDFCRSDLDRVRHSAAHILAQAVKRLYPDVKLAIGPAIQTGFYYDIDFKTPLTEEDLALIEDKMREVIREAHPFVREEMSKADALEYFGSRGEDFKVQIIESIPDETVSIFRDGEFMDLCKGPHVENTSQVKAVKLLSIAGAYWRGSEKNPMLTRIYGTAFPSDKELRAHLFQMEEAKKRDHRKLAKDLDLFSFHEESPGMVFFHKKGFFLFNQLIEFMRSKLDRRGYQEVSAPTILTDDLWKKSGHFENFSDAMFFTAKDEREYAIKPMNCPGHLLIYSSQQRSYRELPLRLAEFGKVFRYEKSGVTHGLMRVRAFTQDDAHHFCTEDQLESEIKDLVLFTQEIYEAFGFDEYRVAISTRPELAMGSTEVWDKATNALCSALDTLKIPYEIHEGEGAFYGPKIEFVIFDSLGRPWQCGTIQVDFSMPSRFGLEYINNDGTRKTPVMIHRAIYGSLERFLGILIEHYGGAFPFWLAPVQVAIAIISEKQEEYANQVLEKLRDANIRVELDARSEKIGRKIRDLESQKIPLIIVLGEQEATGETVAVRGRGRKDLGSMSLSAFIDYCHQQNKERGHCHSRS